MNEQKINRLKKTMNLTVMSQGQKGVIVEIAGGRGLMQRLEALGLRMGAEVEIVSCQPLHGPVVVKIGASRIALGFGVAKKIIVDTGREDEKDSSCR